MTNYCKNRLEIKGTKTDIAAFAQACLTNISPSEPEGILKLHFTNIIPAPKDLDRNEAEKWELDEWGVPPDRVEYDQASLTDTSYSASFSSPWGAPEGIIHAVARRFPRLTIRFIGVEEGNAYCFKLDSRDGAIEAGHLELTDALIEEVEGEGEIDARTASEQEWWDESSQLLKRRMRHFRHWWDERKLKKALTDYPRYTPPHIGLATLGTIAEADENFAYFLSQRDLRIEALKALLGKFGLRLAFDEATKVALDKWLHRYGGLLYVEETRPSFYTYDPAWHTSRISLNVIFDLGVYLGEFAIHETPILSWCLDDWHRPAHGSFDHRFRRPSLISSHTGRCDGFPRDILAELYFFCDAHCNESYFKKRGGPIHRSRHEARQFFSFCLRDIRLRALGEDARANEEFWDRELGK